MKNIFFLILTIAFFSHQCFANDNKPNTLGNGFPGIINQLSVADDMQAALDSNGVRLYSYTRASIPADKQRLIAAKCPTNSIAFIAHQPQRLGKRFLPLIVEIKIVPDNLISPKLINTNLFEAIKTEKLKTFKRKDFVAMSILLPESIKISANSNGERTEGSKLIMDAIVQYSNFLGGTLVNQNQRFVIAESPDSIDATLNFFLQYPNRFTMLIFRDYIPNLSPLNNFSQPLDPIALYHKSTYSPAFKSQIDTLKYRIEKGQGELHTLEYSAENANPWDNPEFIKWILGFTSNGVPINTPGKKNKYDPKNPTFINGIKCSTSEEICSEKKYWPLAAVDGNPKSFFQSANMVKSGGWWMAEFEKPISGRVTIECGILKRKTLQQLYGNMRVEVSSDGVKWQTKGIISKKKGEFSFVENSGKIRFIRVISYSQQEIRLIVRELTIEEL